MTESGKVSSLVIFDSASWLPLMMNTLIPASCSLWTWSARKTCGLHRRLLAVVQVAREQKGVHLFVQAEVHNSDERPACGVSNEIGKRDIAQRERA